MIIIQVLIVLYIRTYHVCAGVAVTVSQGLINRLEREGYVRVPMKNKKLVIEKYVTLLCFELIKDTPVNKSLSSVPNLCTYVTTPDFKDTSIPETFI